MVLKDVTLAHPGSSPLYLPQLSPCEGTLSHLPCTLETSPIISCLQHVLTITQCVKSLISLLLCDAVCELTTHMVSSSQSEEELEF